MKFHHLLLVSSVKPKLEGAEVGVEGGEGEGGGGGGVVKWCTVIAATVRWLIHPSNLDTRY